MGIFISKLVTEYIAKCKKRFPTDS